MRAFRSYGARSDRRSFRRFLRRRGYSKSARRRIMRKYRKRGIAMY